MLAVSGGPDSVHLARRVAGEWTAGHPRVIVACVDHGVRPESGDEVAFTARLAADLSFPFRALRAERERVEKGGRINEARLRAERYRLLEATAHEFGARSIWLAHHRDDQCETILLAALRGGSQVSLAALAGMRRVTRWRHGLELVRPLLAVARPTILQALSACKQPFCCDPSNLDPRFLRNRVRHELLPKLREEFAPDIESRLLRLGRLARVLDRRAQRRATRAIALDGDAVHARLRSLSNHGIPSARLTRRVVLQLDSPNPSVLEIAPGIRIRVGGGALEPVNDEVPVRASRIHLRTLEHERVGARFLARLARWRARGVRPRTLSLDADRLVGELHWRQRRDGDRVHLSQRQHVHKLKDLFADARIAPKDRAVAHVLEDAAGIVAVENLGIAKRMAITATTRRVLRIQFLFDRESPIG